MRIFSNLLRIEKQMCRKEITFVINYSRNEILNENEKMKKMKKIVQNFNLRHNFIISSCEIMRFVYNDLIIHDIVLFMFFFLRLTSIISIHCFFKIDIIIFYTIKR